MKKFTSQLIVYSLSLITVFAQDGWYSGRAERVEPGTFIPGGGGGGGGMMIMGGSSPITVPADDSDLEELARGLQYDPVRIFNYVRDNIAYTPYFGLLKGAQQTLLERSGNDYDQAALLFRLLELCPANYSPVYGCGSMVIPRADAASWLRTTTSATAIGTLLANGGIPYSNTVQNVYVDRVWVEVTIGGTTRRLDPAFKRHYENAGLDIGEMMNENNFDIYRIDVKWNRKKFVQKMQDAPIPEKAKFAKRYFNIELLDEHVEDEAE